MDYFATPHENLKEVLFYHIYIIILHYSFEVKWKYLDQKQS